MSRFMSAVWVVQLFVLLAIAGVCFTSPRLIFRVLENCVTVDAPCSCTRPSGYPGPPHCCTPRGLCTDASVCCTEKGYGSMAACDLHRCRDCPRVFSPGHRVCVLVARDRAVMGLFALARLLAPFFFTFALLSLHAAMREDERVRRNLSFVFAWIYVVLAGLVSTDSFANARLLDANARTRLLLSVLLAMVAFSLYEALRARDRVHRWVSAFSLVAYAGLVGLELREFSHPTVRALAVAVFAFDTLIVGFERIRTRLFALVLLAPVAFVGVALSEGGTQHAPFVAALLEKPLIVRAALAAMVSCVFVHALYAMWPVDSREGSGASTTSTRPPGLWVLWLLQGVLFMGAALLHVWAHQARVETLMQGWGSVHPGYLPLFGDLTEIYPALLVALTLLSFFGMQESREWVWKTVCSIFAAFYASLIFTLVVVWNDVVFHSWTLMLGAAAVVLLVLHLRFMLVHRDWFSEEVGEGPDGWVTNDLVMGPLWLLKTLLTGRRATHAYGVAAWGTFRVLDRAGTGAPDHDFFVAGREHPVQVRFANERFADDASADARGAAIRLSNSKGASPFDLLLSTGAYSSASNVVEFGTIALCNLFGKRGRRYLARTRTFLEGGIAALRRAPGSYLGLIYHSQLVRFWVSPDNRRYLVRYRLVPWPIPEEESGLPVSREDYVNRQRSVGEMRPNDYLRRELKLRLQGELVGTMHLQAQFHRIAPGDGLEWYNPASDWDASGHPWVDIAELVLDDVLPDDECEAMRFDADNAPSSLGTPTATGVFDYRSIADSERRVMQRVQATRKWMIRAFGLPSRMTKPVD